MWDTLPCEKWEAPLCKMGYPLKWETPSEKWETPLRPVTDPPVDKMTHVCENIVLPALLRNASGNKVGNKVLMQNLELIK